MLYKYLSYVENIILNLFLKIQNSLYWEDIEQREL